MPEQNILILSQLDFSALYFMNDACLPSVLWWRCLADGQNMCGGESGPVRSSHQTVSGASKN